MAIFKCKMCGGSLEIAEGINVCECEYCGTQQTLPKTDNEQALNMFNRANHFRQQCEFDKAMEIYERMLSSSNDDAELYWSIVLCRYGIEYVDDPLTKKKIATCHRTQFKSILEDADYLEALAHADSVQRSVYEREAEYIDKVQKGILEISNKEDPFDVFICYKESDENGRRTQDSVLAQDLYYQLEREGFKVFFSRITLESKLGAEYEPYIFAALNSAKVMVVVGTKPEYFNAVWVKNEWSRYLMLMQEDHSRTLIPAYKDMDPYDLPDALSMFQAQDMSKLGFMQDLIRGITKIAKADEPKTTVVKETVVQAANSNTAPLLKRAALFLEDGDWASANEYCNKVLDQDPECAQAYFYMLLAELKLPSENALEAAEYEAGIKEHKNYKTALRFADDGFRERLEYLHSRTIYNFAKNILDSAQNSEEYLKAKRLFEQLGGFMDCKELYGKCGEKADEIYYLKAFDILNKASTGNDFMDAERLFIQLGDYKDSKEKAAECLAKANEVNYSKAITALKIATTSNAFMESRIIFLQLGDYKDSKEKAAECNEKANNLIYSKAVATLNHASTGDECVEAGKLFLQLGSYKDSIEKSRECKEKAKELYYSTAIILMKRKNSHDIDEASSMLRKIFDIDSHYYDEIKPLKDIANKKYMLMSKIELTKSNIRLIDLEYKNFGVFDFARKKERKNKVAPLEKS